MLHRPTLIPRTMRRTGKNTRNVQKDQSWNPSDLCFNRFVENDEIVVVEPTDPDEDRLKEKLQQQESICCAELTVATTESTSPVSKQPFIAEPASTTPPCNNGVQFVPETTPLHSSYVLNTLYGLTGEPRNILTPAINTNPITSVTVRHPLFSTVLVNPVTLNITRQLVGSINTAACTQSTSVMNINTSLLTVKPSDIAVVNTETESISSTNSSTVSSCSNESKICDMQKLDNIDHSSTCAMEVSESPGELNNARTASERRKSKRSARVKRFKCTMPNCCLAFRSRFSLVEHIRTHTGECPFACTIPGCHSAFNRLRTLKHHIKLHNVCQLRIEAMRGTQSSDASTVCVNDCSQLESHSRPPVDPATERNSSSSDPVNNGGSEMKGTDQSAAELRGSNKTVAQADGSQHNQSKYNRSLDLKDIVTKGKYVNTTATEQGIIGCYQCTYPNCDKVYTYVSQLREHVRMHTGERPYMCLEPGCGALFTRLSSAHRHANIHIVNRGCLIRSNPIADGSDLDKLRDPNVSESSSTTLTSTSVTSSGPTASTKATVLNIERLIYRDSTEQSLHEELLRSLEAEPQRAPSTFTTKPPGASARNPPTLLSRRIPRPFVCPLKQCGKSFTKRYQFRDHIWGHTGKRPFVCSKCSGSFVRVHDLRRHEKIHLRSSGDKPESHNSPEQNCETTAS